jgi:hypothetical protein
MYSKTKHIIPYMVLMAMLVIISLLYILVDKKHILQHTFTLTTKDTTQTLKIYGVTHKNVVVDVDENFYFKDYIFIGDTAAIQSIYANGEHPIAIKELLQRDTFIQFTNEIFATAKWKQIYSLKNAIKAYQSRLPIFKQFINWKGDGSLAKEVISNPLFLFFLFFLIAYPIWRKYKRKIPVVHADTKFSIPYWSFLIWMPFLLCTAIIFYQDSYYFLQDDNYAQFTPTIIHGLDGWYQQGSFPTYNPLQLGGTATFEYSTYAFLYPLTHISYWLSKYVLHNPWQFNNVFAVVHFAIGYYFTYKLLTRLAIHPVLSMLAALSFIFCGYNLEAARSWYYVAPTIAFLPVLIYYLTVLGNKKYSFKNYSILIVILSLYAYSGNFQYWIYTVIFILLFSFYTQWKCKKQYLFQWLLLFAVVAILYAPQLILTYFSVKDIDRAGGEGQGIWEGIGSVFFPYLYNNAMPNGWGGAAYRKVSGHFYYGGFLFTLSFLFFIASWLRYKKSVQDFFTINTLLKPFLLLATLALVLAIGRPGLLWMIQSKLPLLNKFNHPFKFLLFAQFFMIVSGAFIVHHFLKPYIHKKIVFAFMSISSILVLLHVVQTKDAFFVYNLQGKPYTTPNFKNLFSKQNDYRILSLAAARSTDALFSHSLTMNFATPQGIASIDGYEPFFQNRYNLFIEHRQASIRYFILAKHTASNTYFMGLKNQLSNFNDYKQFLKIYEDAQVTILENSSYQPIIQFLQKDSAIHVPYTIENKNNGIIVQLPQAVTASQLILGYNYNKNLDVYINHKKKEYTKDAYNRIQVMVQEPVRTITLIYRPLKYLFSKS